MKDIGPFVKSIMEYKGINQNQLAAAIGMSPTNVGYLLRGNANNWKVSYLDATCKLLKVHPMSFFDDFEEKGSTKVENIENNAFLGVSNFSVNSIEDNKNLYELLKEKDDRIKDLNEIIRLQNILLQEKDKSLSKDN